MVDKPPRFITPEGFARIRTEYDELFGSERPKLVETISWAAANGDRSENGDYIYGRKRLREIDRRLSHLAKIMKAAKVVDPAQQSHRPGAVRSDGATRRRRRSPTHAYDRRRRRSGCRLGEDRLERSIRASTSSARGSATSAVRLPGRREKLRGDAIRYPRGY